MVRTAQDGAVLVLGVVRIVHGGLVLRFGLAMVVFFVPPKGPRVAVTFTAPVHLAGERFGAPMGQQMTVQVILALESLTTNIAMVPALFGMGQPVLGQGRRIGEHLGAHVTRLRRRLGVRARLTTTVITIGCCYW